MSLIDADIIASIYDAATDDQSWQRLTGQIRRRLDADSVVLWYRDPDGRFVASASNIANEALGLYETRYGAIDPWGSAARSSGMIGQVLLGTDLIAESDFRQTEFYADFARHIGTTQMVGAGRVFSTGAMMACAAHRPFGVSPFGGRHKESLEQIFSHLARVVRLRMAIKSQDLSRTAETALSHLDTGVVVCNSAGIVQFANRAALKTATSAQMALQCNADPIRCRRAGETAELRAAMTGAAEGGISTTLLLVADDGSRTFVTVRPLDTQRRSVLLLLSDAQVGMALGKDELRRLFGLTAAEAEVASSIVAGRTARQICRDRGVSENTVRTQIATLREKLGVRNQRELILLLGAHCPPHLLWKVDN